MTQFQKPLYHDMFNTATYSKGFPVEMMLYQSFSGTIGDWTFARAGPQWGKDGAGEFVKSASEVPAYHVGSGVLLEGSRTNYFLNSLTPADQEIVIPYSNVQAVATMWGTGSVNIYAMPADTLIDTITEGNHLFFSPDYGGGSTSTRFEIVGVVDKVNVEGKSNGEDSHFGSSFIETDGTPKTRISTRLEKMWNFTNNISGKILFRPQFQGSSGGAYNQKIFSFGTPSENPSTDGLSLQLDAAGAKVSLIRTVGTTSVTVSTLAFMTGSPNVLYDVRFRSDPETGLSLWISDYLKVNKKDPTRFKRPMTMITLNEKIDNTGQPGYSVYESIQIWNESKSDAFLNAI